MLDWAGARSGAGSEGVKGRASRCPVSPFFGDDGVKQMEDFGHSGKLFIVTKKKTHNVLIPAVFSLLALFRKNV